MNNQGYFSVPPNSGFLSSCYCSRVDAEGSDKTSRNEEAMVMGRYRRFVSGFLFQIRIGYPMGPLPEI